MGSISCTKHIPATPEQIFAVLTDGDRRGDWLSIHAGWLETPPAEIAVGTKLVEKVVMLGMANKIEWTIDELDAPRSVVNSGTGMAGVKVRFAFTVTPDGDGSQVAIDGTFTGALIVGALGKAVEKDATKQLETSLENLATIAAGAAV